MKFNLDVNYSIEKTQLNRKRAEARLSRKYFDRVPVSFCLEPRYFTPIHKLTYIDFFKDAETQYYWQLQFGKFRIENIPEDIWPEPAIGVRPYFDNVINTNGLGAEVDWMRDGPPRAIPFIKTVEQMENYQIPAPDAGLWGKVLEWYFEMTELTKQTKVTFNGKPAKVVVSPPSIGGEGPHMQAIDMVGEDFYWWMKDCPEKCHTFLGKITKAMMQAQENYIKIVPRPKGGFGLAEDSAQVMSADMFKEFCVPYDNMLYDAFGSSGPDGRGMHMCGDSTHLHKALVEDIKITSFVYFGCRVKPQIAAKNLGEKVCLMGNIDPVLMLQGSKQQVKTAAMECLTEMAPCGGFTLGDGANICPNTPLENLAVVTEAAEEYGLPELKV